MGGAGVVTESRGSGGDAVYSRVEQLVEAGAGAGRAAARDVAGLAPENEPPLTSPQDLIRQVCHAHSSGAHNSHTMLQPVGYCIVLFTFVIILWST